MLFDSMQYLIFFPVVFFAYFALPKRWSHLWLLAASYYFYMCWNARYALLILFSTVVTYACGLWMETISQRLHGPVAVTAKRALLSVSLLLNLGILFFFKYFDFAAANLQALLGLFHISLAAPKFDVLLPVGISFYTFQALGYTVDVYHERVPAERNFFKYALFVSFFPQLVAGPIERSENLLAQINAPRDFDLQRVRSGLLTIAWGIFLKIVAADNIAYIIDPIFEDYTSYDGVILWQAAIFFALQIYFDFNAYTQIAIGSARALGYDLMENFEVPYMATDIKQFWQRWHISLTRWFQDYVYMPLAMADTSRLTHGAWQHLPPALCQMIVFLLSGLWHGASWHYVAWGALNGLYIILYDATKKLRKRLCARLGIDRKSLGWVCLSRAATFTAVCFSLIFFRADCMQTAFGILRKIFAEVRLHRLFSQAAYSNFKTSRAVMYLSAIAAAVAADYCRYKKIDLKKLLFKQQLVYRWLVYLAMVLLILYWGAYGESNENTQFIYFQF